MNIGMILDKPFPPDPRVENEAQTLIREGHDVHLFCFQYYNERTEFEVINDVRVTRVNVPRHVYKFSALAYTIPYYHHYFRKSISDFIQNNTIQALHIHDMQIARTVFHVNREFKLPVTLDLHENRPEIMKYYAHVNTFLGKLLIHPSSWKKFEYSYIEQADKVIVVTKEAKEYYLSEIPADASKFHVVPNSVRPAFYREYQKEEGIISRYKDRYTILYIGDTGMRRGLETAIQSLGKLIPVIPNIKLVFVGNSKTDDLLHKMVKEANLEGYVDLTGWQDFHLFQSYILSCDIGICPIYRNLHHDTTYANKLFQYLSFGKPIVVSDCTAQKNLVEKHECGLVFRDRNTDEFAESILTLHRDKALYDRLSGNAKTAIREHLNWDKSSRELVDLYEEFSGA
jgi:glycosyltransferase involved in cell wall biosynthesis